MLGNNQSKSDRTKTIQSRVSRRFIPVVMIAFLVIGLMSLFGIRIAANDNLRRTHNDALSDIAQSIQEEIALVREDLRLTATEPTIRQATTEISLGGQIINPQSEVLRQFTTLMRRHPDTYIALRLATTDGAVKAEVTNRDGVQIANAEIQPDRLAADESFQAARSQASNTVLMGAPFTRTNAAGTTETAIAFYSPVPSGSDDNQIVGVLQLEVSSGQFFEAVTETTSGLDWRQVMLLGDKGQVLASSQSGLVTGSSDSGNSGVGSRTNRPELQLDEFLLNNPDNIHLQAVEDQLLSATAFSIENASNMPWRIVLMDNADAILGATNALSALVLVASIAAGIAIVVIVRSLLRGVLIPFDAANDIALQLAEGELDQINTSITARNYQDIADLVTSFERISKRIQNLKHNLENEIERRKRNLDVAARISRETATLRDVELLMNRSIDLICDEFGFYHAQVFLLDDVRINAVLVYSRGEVGQKLLARQHKIPVGSNSVIGQVTATGHPVVIDDTQSENAAHAFNPFLPETRSEMALPLNIGDEIIGALDIQSTETNAFQREDVRAFQMLADQIAIAINNAQILIESEQRINQVDTLNRQLTQQKWKEVEEKAGLAQDYTYNLLQIHPESGEPTTNELTAPIVIRGQEIGRLAAAPPEGQSFGEGDEMILKAVADRVALAIENARLFQETQSSLSETSILYQLSGYLNNADSLLDVLRAITLSIMSDANSGQIWIFEEYPPNSFPELATIAADLPINEREPLDLDLTGTEFYIPDYAFLAGLQHDRVTIISDSQRDNRLDPSLKEFFRRLNAVSVVIIPLSVRGLWRGLIMIEFPGIRNFSERDGRIYAALIDQAGVTIDNRLLLQQTEATLSEIERLYTASRIINTALTAQDLMRAAINSSNDATLNYALGMLEGELDETGWPTQIRMVAQSDGSRIQETDFVQPLYIAPDSPMRQREPEIITDENPNYANVPQMVASLRADGLRFKAIFPLFVSRDQPIALFFITCNEIREISDEDNEVYRAITGQMSTVLQNRRLLTQTEQALNETRRLYEASQAISSAQDSNAIYEAVVEHLAAASNNINRVAILLAGPQPALNAPYLDCVHLWAAEANPASRLQPNSRISADILPIYQLFENVTTVAVLTDLDIDLADNPRLRLALQFPNAASTLVAPMFSRQKWFGVLLCQSSLVGAFDIQYSRFAQAIADQVAIAVENRQLFEEAQMEAQRALALAEAGQFANRIAGEFGRNIREVFARVAEAANYDRWLLMIVRDVPGRLEQVTLQAPGINEKEERMFLDLRTARHSIADAVREDMTILINDPYSYPAFGGYSDNAIEILGKHIVTPVRVGKDVIGSLMVGRGMEAADLTDRDEQLVNTLAAQVGVAFENQRLLRETESERQTLRSILEAMPAGVLVLDANTYKPLQFNDQAQSLLGRPIEISEPFGSVEYNLYQTGTDAHYPEETLPIFTAAVENKLAYSSDIAVIHDDGKQTDLLMNAAPIRDSEGNITAIVAAIEDISNLRNLEKALQETLSETITLYEATRALAEARELDEVLDTTLSNITLQGTYDCFILLRDEETDELHTVRAQRSQPPRFDLPLSILHTDERLIIENIDHPVHLDEATRATLTAHGVNAMMTIPLRGQSRDLSLGWLVLIYDKPHRFHSDEERFLTTLADSASIAIDNRSLFRSTQRALEETASLYNATSTINRATELTELSDALRMALEWLQPDLYACYLQTSHEIGTPLTELFNINLDGAPADFEGIIDRHKLLRDQSLFIEDLKVLRNPTPLERDLIDIGNIRAVASVNLRIKGAPNGRLFIAYHQFRSFKEDEIRYINAVVDSASVVIDNILLFDQIQSALEETSILYQASQALTDASNADDILQAVVNHVIQPHITQVFMMLLKGERWDTESVTAEVAAHWDQTGQNNLLGKEFDAESLPWWGLLGVSSVLTIDDIEAEESLNPQQRESLAAIQIRSLVVIPLRSANQSIGVLCLGSSEQHRHTERDLRVYQSFAEQTSLSIEATRSLEQANRRARQLATSAEVSRSANSILDLQALLDRAVNLIRDSFGYDHVQVFLMDEDDNFAELRASTGEAGQQLLAIQHKLQKGSSSVIGQVTEQGIPIIAADTADARYVHRPNPYLPLTRSEMALPLNIQNQVVGALDVQSNNPRAFSQEDVDVLSTLAAQISVAIYNARLFTQSERRASDMGLLFDVTTVAAAAETLEEALENVADQLRASLDAQVTVIYLPQSYVDEKRDEIIVMMQPIGLAAAEQFAESVVPIQIGDYGNLVSRAGTDLLPRIIDNIATETSYVPVSAKAQSAMIMPLETASNLVGMIVLESAEVDAFNDDTLKLLRTLSGTLSAIIQNAQLLEQAQRTAEQLRELDRLKTDFLANMSHELRTPLNSIIGFSRVILKGIDGPLTEMQEQDLSTIYNSGQHLLNLINDILDQAKIAAGKMDLQLDYFEIKAVIEGVRSIGIGLVKDKPIDIRVDMAPGLPKAYGDEFRTRQVLLNLISNAAKFTQQGSITITVYPIREENISNPMIRVDVTDTGIGIAEKDLPLLFEAFRQVDSSLTRTAGGTGLGLPIAKSLVEMQHGNMFVRSEVNVGSTFSITIPTEPFVETEDEVVARPGANGTGDTVEIESASTQDEETEPLPTTAVTTTGPLRPVMPALPIIQPKRQILVIEDNPDMVDQFRRALRNEGFDILAASIPLEAEAMASGLRPTLIIMDVNFANGAGWTILRKLKERDDTFDIPVIIVTLNDETERAYQTGAYAVIQRPFVPEELFEAVLKAEEESNTERILIIDDQPEDTHLIKQLLDEYGHFRVFTAHNGVEGVSMVARRRPNLVLLDLRMPEMDGFAVLNELRSNPETLNIPIVVITNDTLKPDELDLLDNVNIPILYKVEITQDDVQQLIKGVKTQLSRANGE